MKKIVRLFSCFVLSISLLNIRSFAMPETLPADLGSNSELIEVLSPEESKFISYSETCLFSCIAEPGTHVTLFEKLTDSLYVPMLLDDEAITAKVGESGVLVFELTFDNESENKIMLYAEKSGKYQTIQKTIIIKNPIKKESVKYKTVNMQEFFNQYFVY